MSDWGAGFVGVDGLDTGARPTCKVHADRFLTHEINALDVGVTLCLACVPEERLTAKGRAMLLQRQQEIADEIPLNLWRRFLDVVRRSR